MTLSESQLKQIIRESVMAALSIEEEYDPNQYKQQVQSGNMKMTGKFVPRTNARAEFVPVKGNNTPQSQPQNAGLVAMLQQIDKLIIEAMELAEKTGRTQISTHLLKAKAACEQNLRGEMYGKK